MTVKKYTLPKISVLGWPTVKSELISGITEQAMNGLVWKNITSVNLKFFREKSLILLLQTDGATMQHFLSASLTTLIDEDGENVSIYRKFLYDREENPFEEQTTSFFLDDVSEIVVKRSYYIEILF